MMWYMYSMYASQLGKDENAAFLKLLRHVSTFAGKPIFTVMVDDTPLICNLGMLFGLVMQLYWFGLILKGAVKVSMKMLYAKDKKM